MSRTNETRHIKWHEACKCQCRLDASVCNNKQRWNNEKCRCECKELIYKRICDKRFIWNPSNCEYERDKSCDVGKYIDYENCKCINRYVDKLVEQCTKNLEEEKLAEITLAEEENEHKNKCSSYALYIALFSIILTINIWVGTHFIYYTYMNRHKKTTPRYNYVYQAANY